MQKAVQQGVKRFVIPPGNYRFEGKAGHDFLLAELTGFTLEAAGATFYFDPHFGVRIVNCHDLTIHGLTVDTDPLPWMQGRILAFEPLAPTIDLELEPGYAPLAPVSYRMVFFDGKSGAPLWVMDSTATEVQDLGERRVRLTKISRNHPFLDPGFPRPIAVGDRLALLDPRFGGGNVVLQGCEKVTLDSVIQYGAGGFAFNEIAGKGGDHYVNCKLVLRPNSTRLMASRADAFHSLVMEKGPLVENCEFSHAGDDLLAVHGFFSLVTAKTGPRDFTVAYTAGIPFFVGSTAHLLRLPDGTAVADATVTALEEIKDPAQIQATKDLRAQIRQELKLSVRSTNGSRLFHVHVDRDVPADRFDLIESDDCCGAGAVIRGNYLHDGNVRGILLKSHDVTIENNVIERTAHGGIVLEAEAFWFEGPFNRRIQVVGNHLRENGFGVFDHGGMSATMAAIHVGDYFGQRLFPRTLIADEQNEDIVIDNNDIERPAAFGILLMNTRGAQIDDNRIRSPFASGQNPGFFDLSRLLAKGWLPTADALDRLKNPFYAIFVEAASNLQVSHNEVLNAPVFLKGDVGYGPSTPAVSPTPQN